MITATHLDTVIQGADGAPEVTAERLVLVVDEEMAAILRAVDLTSPTQPDAATCRLLARPVAAALQPGQP